MMATDKHPLDDSIPMIEPGTFDDADITQAHTPLPHGDIRIIKQLVTYGRLRPACVPRVMAAVLKHFALPLVKEDIGRLRLTQIRELLLGLAAQMDVERG